MVARQITTFVHWLSYGSGPGAFDPSDPVLSSDYATAETTDDLALALESIVQELCQPSITANKLVINPETREYELADGWEFAATADPGQAPFHWIEP